MNNPKNVDHVKMRGIYLLPNLFTTAALFSGFYAIVAAINSEFEAAAIAIFLAMIMDSVDGRVARLTGTQTEFGAQFDSMSDMVCFGITPALVVYNWGLSSLGKIGWLAAFLYAAVTALRLARFNTQVHDNKYFIGLPCPSAAAIVAASVWIATDFEIPGKNISVLIAIVTVIVGLLMVSNIKYHSFKQLDFKEHVPFVTVLLVVILYALIAWDPPKVLFSIFFLYVLSGPMFLIKNKLFANRKKNNKKKKLKRKTKENDDNTNK